MAHFRTAALLALALLAKAQNGLATKTIAIDGVRVHG